MPITYVTNGIHTCSWLSPKLKELYNKYLMPYWQDNIHEDKVWEKINNIPDKTLWETHQDRKEKLLKLVKDNTTQRLRRSGYSYEEINEITSKLNPNALTIGFARKTREKESRKERDRGKTGKTACRKTGAERTAI